MRTQRVKVSEIHVAENRKRKHIDEKIVGAIAASIEKIGLQNPISVYFADDYEVDGELYDSVPILAAGAHRREALLRLGSKFEYADCVIFEDASSARLWEISENLHRKDLTVDERSDHVAEWIALTEDRQRKERLSRQVAEKVDKLGRINASRPESGISAASRELGLDDTAARRAMKIASRTPEAKEAARAAGLADNQKALLEIARAAPDKQVEKVAEIAARRSTPPKPVSAEKAMSVMIGDLSVRAQAAESKSDDWVGRAEEVIDHLGRENMPYLLGLLEGSPKRLAAEIRKIIS